MVSATSVYGFAAIDSRAKARERVAAERVRKIVIRNKPSLPRSRRLSIGVALVVLRGIVLIESCVSCRRVVVAEPLLEVRKRLVAQRLEEPVRVCAPRMRAHFVFQNPPCDPLELRNRSEEGRGPIDGQAPENGAVAQGAVCAGTTRNCARCERRAISSDPLKNAASLAYSLRRYR